VSGEEGSLGEIRKALAGITRRLDALADVVGAAAATAPPGALLDEATRSRLAGLESLLAIGRRTSQSEACLLAIDRAFTYARADCAAILQPTREGTLTVLAERGFRLPLEARADEGIVGRAIRSAEVVQAGPGLGGPDTLLDRHGLGAALAIPVPDRAGLPAGALLVGRRRPVPFEPEAVGTLVTVADRLADAFHVRAAGTGDEATPSALFVSLDPARTARAVATEAATRLGAEVAAVFLPDGDGFVLAGAAGLPDDAPAPGPAPPLETVAATRRAWIRTPEDQGDPGLARCLGTTPRAVLPLSVEGGLVALLAVGSSGACGTALPEPFERAAALALRNARLHAESLRILTDAPAPLAVAPDTGAAPLGDMANLLAVVLGRLAAVRDRVTDAAAARDLAHAEEAAWRVAEGVRRVLGFAPGSGAPSAAPLDIAVAVRDSVRAMERLWANEGGVPQVTLDLEPVPPVRVDPDEFRKALHHLLQNAREAGDRAGSVAVWLRWNGATHVELTVSDRGRGMDEPTRARADEPFFTTKGPGRLGVGLAVVRAMASRYRGELDIESAPGTGTTIRLRLPTAAGPRTTLIRPEPISPGQRRILVVDDEQAVREALVEGLTHAGYVVHATGDVGDAVAALGREPVDLVLTDLVLPGGSGLEIARTVKRTHPGIPVILVTGWPGRIDQQTLEGQGIDVILEKPVGLDKLLAAVTTLIERASARPR
jgi:signal transduction histidine kinase/ActR/RegA family two-component response regulator